MSLVYHMKKEQTGRAKTQYKSDASLLLVIRKSSSIVHKYVGILS